MRYVALFGYLNQNISFTVKFFTEAETIWQQEQTDGVQDKQLTIVYSFFYVTESNECVFHLRFATHSQNMTEYKRIITKRFK
jgi:hypothetical protein